MRSLTRAPVVASEPAVAAEPVEILPLTPPAPRPRAANDPRERRRLAALQATQPAVVATPTVVDEAATNTTSVVESAVVEPATDVVAVAAEATPVAELTTEPVGDVTCAPEAEALADAVDTASVAVEESPSAEQRALAHDDSAQTATVAEINTSPVADAVLTSEATTTLDAVVDSSDDTADATGDEALAEGGEDAPARRPRRPRTGGRPPKKRNPAN
jgi:hypothetical protein